MDAVGFGGLFKLTCARSGVSTEVSGLFGQLRGTCPALGSPGRYPDGDAVDEIPGDWTGGQTIFRCTAGGAGAIA